jgi:hypothetical protein
LDEGKAKGTGKLIISQEVFLINEVWICWTITLASLSISPTGWGIILKCVASLFNRTEPQVPLPIIQSLMHTSLTFLPYCMMLPFFSVSLGVTSQINY